MAAQPILVLGIGNVLMGDEGVGVHAIAHLEREPLPAHAHLLDGGTGGFHLLAALEAHAHAVIVDATIDGRRAGTVSVLEPRYASDYPRTLSAHDIGLKDLVEAAELLGQLPKMWLVTVSIDGLQPMSLELSAPARAALPEAARAVLDIVNRLPAESGAAASPAERTRCPTCAGATARAAAVQQPASGPRDGA